MSWSERRTNAARLVRLAVVFAAAGLVAGCFQPLYGDRTVGGGKGVRSQLASVEVFPIRVPNGTPEARIAVELQNDLIFAMTGGSGGNSPTHQLRIEIKSSRQSVIVDSTTARSDVDQYGINAAYSLVDLSTGKVVSNGETFARVSYDIPGQEQRFARDRGQRDAENRAAKLIADNITSRLASFFIAGS